MAGFEKLDHFTLLQREEQHAVFTSYRGGDIEGGRLTQHVRIDVVNPALSANKSFTDQVAAQSLVSSKLDHTNITKKLSLAQQGGSLGSVYEYLEGFSLQSVLERSRSEGFPFSIDHALLVANKLVNALAYAKSKNVHHGLVHPAFVFITNEGEIKLKGFGLSQALKSVIASHSDVEAFLNPYLPNSTHAGGGEPERFDLFAGGAILFEMLTGNQFYSGGRDADAAALIAKSETAADMEPIPDSISKILLASIDPGSAGAYSDIQDMARDIESLIFSGEYSPTTFNLAFFMHSAFRSEIEVINTQIKSERETVFDDSAASPAVSPAAPPVQPQAPAAPVARPATVTPAVPAKKSKLPMVIGIVALLVVVILAAYFLMPKKSGTQDDRYRQQEQELLAQRRSENLRQQKEREEMMRLEIEALRAQIEEKNRTAQSEEKEQVQSEIEDIDEKMRLAKERAALQAQLKEQERKLQEIQEQKEEEQAAMERQLAEERERARIAAEKAAAEAEAEPDDSQDAMQAGQRPVQTEVADGTTPPDESQTTSDGSSNTASETQTKTPEETPVQEPEETQVAKLDREQSPRPESNMVAVPETPPEEGDLVEIDDTVKQPVLEDTLKFLVVPQKAVRNGVVHKGQIKTFLIKALVNEKGRVDEVELVRNPMSSYEDDYDMPDKALKQAKKLKFTPAEKMGVKVKVWTHVGIHFKAM